MLQSSYKLIFKRRYNRVQVTKRTAAIKRSHERNTALDKSQQQCKTKSQNKRKAKKNIFQTKTSRKKHEKKEMIDFHQSHDFNGD